MERITGSYSIGRRSGMELVTCMSVSDLGKWCGYLKDQPHDQVYGESFELLQPKFNRLHRDLNQATPSSPRYNKALLRWYWQQHISVSRY